MRNLKILGVVAAVLALISGILLASMIGKACDDGSISITIEHSTKGK